MMIKKIFPLLLLLIGTGAGVAAGIFVRPDVEPEKDMVTDNSAPQIESETIDEDKEVDTTEETETNEYVKLKNQLVIPIVVDERVAALVVIALSIEVPAGQSELVTQHEPKLRDRFLQVLFDHANIGGFNGNFTDTKVLGPLRTALKEVAQRDIGSDLVKDVLIIEIARQDY